MLDMYLPVEFDQHENVQSLINKHLNTVEYVNCDNKVCKAQVQVKTKKEILHSQEAVIIHIDRFLPTPENDIRGITDEAEIRRRQAIPYKKEDRPLKLSHVIRLPLFAGNGYVQYSLVATVQHLGSTGTISFFCPYYNYKLWP